MQNITIKWLTIKKWLLSPSSGEFILTPELFELAKEIASEGWISRSKEKHQPLPEDMSGGCKFSSIYFKLLFGGQMQGNYLHQFNVLNGKVFDLNKDCNDVKQMKKEFIDKIGENPYKHDICFFGNPDHIESMQNCFNRSLEWSKEFKIRHKELLNSPNQQFSP